MTEIHLELLLGAQIHDIDDRPIGRLEEIKAEAAGKDFVVVEYHLGVLGLLERLSATTIGHTILRPFGFKERPSGHIVPWDKLDLTDTTHLKLRCTAAELDARPR
ncbi:MULTISPECIES: PRC-barrel domain containing protein [unclassified Rhizobium]|uniref:PRC-barrel domain containing protein n=1 Tax=unclassified Rhizobium TaxID=2613769 RepID=UPI000EA8DF78|nr:MULTISPECIES: PRC-barrel domain containing protein [unclassified Rhizobium]AYG68489.1 PRC-barrel domain containing protein [Rhizobium sp. CCGE531]AYG74872.1 PRC-barrel domain containing protein [Rhizobium sp. CCGE532]